MTRLVTLVLCTIAVVFAFSDSAEFFVDVTNATGAWTHYFSSCVGSGHASLALRTDWQEQLKQIHTDLGFQQVRFHGLLVDDMSIVLPNGTGNQTWSHYGANVTPPKDWQAWVNLIQALASHLISRYGISEVSSWNFEVWNEPNCCPHFFWSGDQQDYFTLFKYTSFALKKVSPKLRVGGPATAMSAWIPDFMHFCEQNKVVYDFISTHEYPTDPPGPETRRFFSEVLKKTRQTVGPEIPIYYTEYDDGYNDATSYAAAFAVYQAFSVNGVVDALSWWVFSDLFEEEGLRSDPFDVSGSLPVAGLMNIYGIPKPSYRAFQLLHWSGDTLVDTQPDFNFYPTVGTFTVTGNHTSIFIVNWDVKRNPISDVSVTVQVSGIPNPANSKAVLYFIDNVHGNAMPTWIKMGSPFYLTEEQVDILKLASEIVPLEIQPKIVGNDLVFSVQVPGNTVANIVVL